jgi:hypothetical protein
MSVVSVIQRLENYSIRFPQDVLLVTARVETELQEIMIFKGFSSSLTHPTAFDPDIPVLSEDAVILTIDRLQSPYTPNSPIFIEQGLSWDMMQLRLETLGL